MKKILATLALAFLVPGTAGATGYARTTRATMTLDKMFLQSGHFGFPPYAADPFTCSAAVTAERAMYYNTTSHSVFFCNGTSWTAMGGLSSPIAGDFVATGKWTFGSAADAAGSVRVGETANCIVIEGTGVDAHETNICATNPTADITFSTPDAAAGSYAFLTSAAAVTLAQGGTGLTAAADDTTLVSGGASYTATAIPDCDDSVGKHLNYDTGTNAFSCGTTTSAGSTFSDAAFTLQDDATPTKQLQFQLSGITAATTRTFTVPDASGTLPLLGLAQTWGANQSISSNSYFVMNSTTAGGGLGYETTQTPDGIQFMLGTVSKSVRIKETGDYNLDSGNGPCGTSACADPTLIVMSHNGDTDAEYVSLQHDGTDASLQTGTGLVRITSAGNGVQVGSDSATAADQVISGPDGLGTDKVGGAITIEGGLPTGAGAAGSVVVKTAFASTTGSGEIASVQRAIYHAKKIAAADNTATTILTLAIPAATSCSGSLEFEGTTLDATNVHGYHASVTWAIVQNVAGGTYGTDVDAIGASTGITGGGTYTGVFSVTTGANTASIQVTLDSSLNTASTAIVTVVSNSGCSLTFP